MESNNEGNYIFLGFNLSPTNLEETLRIHEAKYGKLILGTPLHQVSGEYLYKYPRLSGAYCLDEPPGTVKKFFHPAWQGGIITLQAGKEKKERYEAERSQKIANQKVQQ